MNDSERKRVAEQWMRAFVGMWSDVEGRNRRYRDDIEDAVRRLDAGAPQWEVASRLRAALSAVPQEGS